MTLYEDLKHRIFLIKVYMFGCICTSLLLAWYGQPILSAYICIVFYFVGGAILCFLVKELKSLERRIIKIDK